MDRLNRLLVGFPAVVVSGASQVGKSTLAQRWIGDRGNVVVFDPIADVENARSEPELFLDNIGTPCVLDEIQYVPELVPALKRRIDRDRRPGQYLLTGSQQWEVLRKLSESLAGRVAFIDLDGFSLRECASEVSGPSWLERWLDDPELFLSSRQRRLNKRRPLYERLWRGFLPQAEFLHEDVISDFHAGYQRTYIERDARSLGDVVDWRQFGRFFRLSSALTAQEINRSQLGRDIGITPQTARRWLDMLEATYQWHSVSAWSGNSIKRISQKSKGYVSDSGLACHALRLSSPRALADHPSLGAIFETAVVGEIRRLISTLTTRPLLHHWRAHSGSEVDLLLERDGILYPIEIKATAHPSSKDTRGIRAFREAYPHERIARGLVIAPTESVFPIDELDTAIPWDLA